MAIEFFCPGCGKLMRTPDETAGRKGRCPSCSLKVQIPLASVASNSSSSNVVPMPSATPAPASPNTTVQLAPNIQFACQSCGKQLSVPSASAGKKGKCPHCSVVMSIPARSPTPEAKPTTQQSADRWRGTPKQRPQPVPPTNKPVAATKPVPAPQAGAKIEFSCEKCGRVVRVAASAAGQQGQCPQCKSVMQIPHKSRVATPGLQPTGPSGLQPLDAGGLMPLDGLTPLNDGGLTPIDNFGLSPLGDMGLTPFNAEMSSPFAGGLSTGFPVAPSPNPYAAPAPLTTAKPRRSAPPRSGAITATKVCAGFIIFYAVAQMVATGISLALNSGQAMSMMSQMQEEQGEPGAAFVAGFVVAGVVAGILLLVILAGGVQMIRLKTWGLCLTACILALVPCNCPVCMLGIPVGIWGIVMLSQQSVRSAFT